MSLGMRDCVMFFQMVLSCNSQVDGLISDVPFCHLRKISQICSQFWWRDTSSTTISFLAALLSPYVL
jgi:hypothetical protein